MNKPLGVAGKAVIRKDGRFLLIRRSLRSHFDPGRWELPVERLDLARDRFGFRETWIEKDRIFFNGRADRFNSVGTAPSISIRYHHTLGRGSMVVDYNDETGDPITTLVTGLVNTPSKHNVASDEFWKTTEANARVAVKRAWNHPSIIAWDLSNEWYTYAPYTGADMTLCGKRFIGLSQRTEG